MVRIKASQTLNSRHLTGHAVDVAPVYNGKISWDWPLYYVLADCIKTAAKLVDVPIEWGGDWKRAKDGPHWQLPWKEYPK
jgi:peptidoglycan L-alanyl-D-glutamate endopeptidase CwlK